mmetsp:Transcript_103774/g.288972  ORF Transcript_103774/g.288972 Transcript_103774/m.288972 type:complete len:224 (-) Transcript_103774:1087-1758(-)
MEVRAAGPLAAGAVHLAVHDVPEGCEAHLLIPTGVHLCEQRLRLPTAQDLRNGRPLQECTDVVQVQKTLAFPVHLTEDPPEEFILHRFSGSNELAHELLVRDLAAFAVHECLDEPLYALLGPQVPQPLAHVVCGDNAVVVDIELEEKLVQFLQLRKVLTGGEVGQEGLLDVRLLLPLHEHSQDALINGLLSICCAGEPGILQGLGDDRPATEVFVDHSSDQPQ